MNSIPLVQHPHSNAVSSSGQEEDWFTSKTTGDGQHTMLIDRIGGIGNKIPHTVYSNVSNCRFDDDDTGKVTRGGVEDMDVYNTISILEDSPGVARARRLLSTMKQQRENASLQLQKSGESNNNNSTITKNIVIDNSTSQNKEIITNHKIIQHDKKRDTSYYDNINQELRSRIQQKIENQQQQHNSNHSSKSLSSYISSSKFGEDNQTVSTAQSTFCKTTTTTTTTSSMGSSSISTDSWRGLSRPICIPIQESPTNTSNVSKISVPIDQDESNLSRTKSKETNMEIQIQPTNSMIEELTALLAQCNENISASQQTSLTDDIKEMSNKSRIKSRSTRTSSSPKRSSSSRKQSSPIKRRQQQQQQRSSGNPHHIAVREISFVKSVDESTTKSSSSSPRRTRSEHNNRTISFRKAQSFDSSRIGIGKSLQHDDPILRQSDDSNDNNNCSISPNKKVHPQTPRNQLFLSASADDVNSNNNCEPRTRTSSPRKRDPTTTTKLVPASRQRDKLHRKLPSNNHSPVSITIGTIQSGASTASVTTSDSSDNSKPNNINTIFVGIPQQQQSPSSPQHHPTQTTTTRQSPTSSSTSIPRLVHSYHDRSNNFLDDISAMSLLSTYRCNSLSPKARRRPNARSTSNDTNANNRLNRLPRGISLKDIGIPLGDCGIVNSSPTNTTHRTVAQSTINHIGKTNSTYSTDLLLKQVRNEVTTMKEDTLDTPEGRKSFIRHLYQSNSSGTCNNIVDETSNSLSLVQENNSSQLSSSLPYSIDIIPNEINEETQAAANAPSATNETKGVRAIINAFQAINTAVKQDIDVSTRIKAEYPIPKKFQNQRRQNIDKVDTLKSAIATTYVNEEEYIEQVQTESKVTNPKGILVNRIKSFANDDDNETATFDATLDVTYDEDSVCTSGSDTSGWISNSSNTYTLEYDIDLTARSSKATTSNLLSNQSLKSANKVETSKKKKKKKDTRETTTKSGNTETTSPVHYNHDNNCADTISLLSADWIEDERMISQGTVVEDAKMIVTPPLHKNKQSTESIDFSPCEELRWKNHESPRKKRVCFAPNSDMQQLDIYYYPPEDMTTTEENDRRIEDEVKTIQQSSVQIASDQVSDKKCCTCGCPYNPTVFSGYAIGNPDTSDFNLNTDRHCDTTASTSRLQVEQNGTKNILNIRNQAGRDSRGTRISNKKPVQKGKKSTGRKLSTPYVGTLIPASGGLYDIALQSGLTKDQIISREPYKVVVDLKKKEKVILNEAESASDGGIIRDYISDQRCGAKGGMLYLASSITHIPKRKPLEPDIYWVD